MIAPNEVFDTTMSNAHKGDSNMIQIPSVLWVFLEWQRQAAAHLAELEGVACGGGEQPRQDLFLHVRGPVLCRRGLETLKTPSDLRLIETWQTK